MAYLLPWLDGLTVDHAGGWTALTALTLTFEHRQHMIGRFPQSIIALAVETTLHPIVLLTKTCGVSAWLPHGGV